MFVEVDVMNLLYVLMIYGIVAPKERDLTYGFVDPKPARSDTNQRNHIQNLSFFWP